MPATNMIHYQNPNGISHPASNKAGKPHRGPGKKKEVYRKKFSHDFERPEARKNVCSLEKKKIKLKLAQLRLRG